MLCLVRMADVTLVLQVARISDEQRKYMRVFLFAINVF